MRQRTFNLTVGIVFLLVALLHTARLVYSWRAVIGSWVMPFWVSGVALAVALYLAYQGITLSRRG